MPKLDKILVSGSSRLSPEFHPFAEALGREIIESTDWVLITGGLKRAEEGFLATDYLVANSALNAANELNIDPNQRIITMLPQRDRDGVERIDFGKEIQVKHSRTKTRRYSMVLTSDAVFAIGGSIEGTGENIDLAYIAGIPVLPIHCTGGASKVCWDKYAIDLKEMFKISDSEQTILKSQNIRPEKLAKTCIDLMKRCLKPRCFIAMQFSHQPLPGLFGSIRQVVEHKGYIPVRVDQEYFTGSIVETIWDEIRASEIIIADITDYNPNVFYELGIGHAFGKTTLITIFNKYGKVPEKIPFDIAVQRVLPYDTLQTLKDVLEQHIPALQDQCIDDI